MFLVKSVGVGIIGYGIGKVHALSWSNVPLFYRPEVLPRLEAICARDEKKVATLAKEFGFTKSYSDWKELVKDPGVNIVDNCAPPNLHLEPCVVAAEAGKAILCEKPLARSSDEAYEMYRAVSRRGVVAMTGFTFRFAPAVMLAKELIDSGRLGRIFSVRCSYLNIESGGRGYLDPEYPMHWHMDAGLAGHGAISDLGSHALDMARFLGGEVKEVCGATSTFIKERPSNAANQTKKEKVTAEDSAVANLKFSSGALGTIDCSWLAPGVKDFFYFEVHGSKGSVRFNVERLDELQVYLKDDDEPETNGFKTVAAISKKHPEMEQFWVDQGGGFSWQHLFVVELKHFLDGVAKGELVGGVAPSFKDGYINALLIDSIAESSERKEWVKVSPKVP